MRIAHVLHRLTLAGAEVLAADLARRLRDQCGHAFVFICLDGVGPLGEALRSEGFVVECVDRKPGIDAAARRRIRALLREHRIDLIHAHQYTPFFYAAWARQRGQQRHPPIVFTEHGRHVPDVVSWRRRLANRWLLKRGDAVTAVSRFVKAALVAHEGIAVDRIEVIHNGIDLRKFARGNNVHQRVRHELGVADQDVVLLHVARFHAVKDHATAVRAVAKVRGIPGGGGAKPQAVFVGEGELRGATEALARELGVCEYVRFLGVRSDVADLLAGADVLMLSSLSEGLPVTVLEAMAAGVAVAATAVGGVTEVVEDGVTGLLSPSGNADALAANLARLVGDPALRAAMGIAGRQRLDAHFTQRQMHDAYAAVYDRMIPPR